LTGLIWRKFSIDRQTIVLHAVRRQGFRMHDSETITDRYGKVAFTIPGE